MKTRLYNLLLLAFIAIIAFNCANRGTPTGGEKDILPPKIVKSTPENYSINFKDKEIIIYFDEYVKIKNLSKQLIISPPMKYEPDITPLSTASKFIKIKIKDTLAANTTYSFNFGNSIVDNNEENPFPYYKYVLSTGTYIDSLKIHGQIFDALNRTPEKNVLVNLYEIDSTYNDSIVFKEKPKYMTNTGDSTTVFTIENIKAGQYKLVALKDENQDYKFQQKIDKIAFHDEIITVGQDSVFYDLKLFKEAVNYRALTPRLIAGEKIAFGYEGDYESMQIENLSKTLKSRVIKQQDADSLLYFYSPKLEIDSLIFKVTNKKVIDTFTVRIKDNRKDTLRVVDLNKGKLGLKDDLKINANIPFITIDESKIKIIDKDSTTIAFTSVLDSLDNVYHIKFDKKEDNRYKVDILPEAFTDFFDQKNDTLQFRVSTPKLSSFTDGNRVVLKNAVYPLFIQFVDDKNDVKYERYVTKDVAVDFEYVTPGIYYLRVLFDTNKNGVYDSGNYLKSEQPEKTAYYSEPIEARAGWEEVTTFSLKK